MKTLSTFAVNQIQLCKGHNAHKIVMLWQMGRLQPSVIEELAEYFGVENDIYAVANELSKL
jgi:hypothetical protein